MAKLLLIIGEPLISLPYVTSTHLTAFIDAIFGILFKVRLKSIALDECLQFFSIHEFK